MVLRKPRLAGLLVALAVLAAPTLAAAKTAVVHYHDGRSLEGEIVDEPPGAIRFKDSSGITITIQRDDIKKIEYRKSPLEAYRDRKAALDADDERGLFQAIHELYKAGYVKQAKAEVAAARETFPESRRLMALAKEIDDTLAGDAAPDAGEGDDPQPDAGDGNDEGDRGDAAAAATQGPKIPAISEADMHLIRLWELPSDLSKASPKPRVRVPRDTLREVFREYADNPLTPKGRTDQNNMLRAPGWEQLNLLFKLSAREFYKDVEVLQDPEPLREFRRINARYINDWFIERFGDGSIEGLALHRNVNTRMDRALYTNFYILSEWQDAQGRRMIDRASPSDSLLLQWGLDPTIAKYPAPRKSGAGRFVPFFPRGVDDPQFKAMAEWIGSLYRDPDYGVETEIPGLIKPDADAADDAEDPDAPAGDGPADPVAADPEPEPAA